jgi:hypothetical protein
MGMQIFREKLTHLPVFSIQDIRKFFPAFDRKRLVEWKDKGYITAISRGFYAWPGALYSEQDKWAMACKVYPPAYISMESALSYYGMIPEAVFSNTAITTHKTRAFSVNETGFFFRTIQPSLFFGYTFQRAPNGMPYSLAYPEKVLLDWLYLHPFIKDPNDFESLRWNKAAWLSVIDQHRMTNYKAAFDGHTFNHRFNIFQSWLHD